MKLSIFATLAVCALVSSAGAGFPGGGFRYADGFSRYGLRRSNHSVAAGVVYSGRSKALPSKTAAATSRSGYNLALR